MNLAFTDPIKPPYQKIGKNYKTKETPLLYKGPVDTRKKYINQNYSLNSIRNDLKMHVTDIFMITAKI